MGWLKEMKQSCAFLCPANTHPDHLPSSIARESRERSLLDEKLLKTIPLVNEANAVSDELKRGLNFETKLMANPSK